MSKLAVAVVGVGHHGRHHARILSQMPDVELVGVVDSDQLAARSVAESTGTRAYRSIDDIMDRIDAACIAVPTIFHHAIARPLLSRGISTLIEKPMTFDLFEAEDLVSLARARRAVLMPGHVERFNPAWAAFDESGVEPRFIEATRMSRYPFRSIDVSVVFDLMVHDIDLVLSATGSAVRSVRVVGNKVLSPTPDWAQVRLELEDGLVANLLASRVHHETQRRIRLAGECASVEIDLFRRTSVTQRRRDVAIDECLSRVGPRPSPEEKDLLFQQLFEVETGNYDRSAEPLRRELEEFIRCLQEGRDPLVTAEDGLRAVRLAFEIDELMRGAKRENRRSA